MLVRSHRPIHGVGRFISRRHGQRLREFIETYAAVANRMTPKMTPGPSVLLEMLDARGNPSPSSRPVVVLFTVSSCDLRCNIVLGSAP